MWDEKVGVKKVERIELGLRGEAESGVTGQ
jgi:hypothetical protein